MAAKKKSKGKTQIKVIYVDKSKKKKKTKKRQKKKSFRQNLRIKSNWIFFTTKKRPKNQNRF